MAGVAEGIVVEGRVCGGAVAAEGEGVSIRWSRRNGSIKESSIPPVFSGAGGVAGAIGRSGKGPLPSPGKIILVPIRPTT